MIKRFSNPNILLGIAEKGQELKPSLSEASASYNEASQWSKGHWREVASLSEQHQR
ncbi:hypothetical protein L195_g042221, partial [Trifolium pratense]